MRRIRESAAPFRMGAIRASQAMRQTNKRGPKSRFMATPLLLTGPESLYTSIRSCARAKAGRWTEPWTCLRWNVVPLVPLIVVLMASSAHAQSAPASRVVTLTNEVNAVRPLACEASSARSDTFYKKALVGAINELRGAVQARMSEIQSSQEMTEDEKQLIIQQKYGAMLTMIENAVPAAIAKDEAKAVSTVCSFNATPAASRLRRPLDPLPQISERLKLSRVAIDFGDKEVNGDIGEDSFLITNDVATTTFQIRTRGPA